jgi:nitrate reductase NapAB chaperone NapD
MEKLLTICLIMATIFTANAQFNYTDLNHWIIVIEETTFDNVKTEISQLDFTLVTEKHSDSQDVVVFENKEKERFIFNYENKKLKSLIGTVFLMSKPYMVRDLQDKGYTIISKEKIKKDNQSKEVITWNKPNRPYKFVFTEANDFQSILEIKIDVSAVTHIVNLDNMPPIQLFLDKIEGEKFEENMSQQQNLTQKLTNNSFTHVDKHISSGKIYRSEVKGIAWGNFKRVETYTLKNADKYVGCTFYFENNLNKKSFSNDEEYGSYDNYNYFTCFIYAKDKEAFLKVIKEWENTRN